MAKWIQNRKPPYNLIPVEEYVDDGTPGAGQKVFGDLPDFVSPVTGETIHGRAGMRAHMKEHQLAHMDDFKQYWKDSAKERDEYSRGVSKKHRREVREALVESMKKLGG